MWSKGLVKLSPKLGIFFGVIPACANGIGAEVLPGRSIEPNALAIPPPDLTAIARQISTSINRYRVSKPVALMLMELVGVQRSLYG